MKIAFVSVEISNHRLLKLYLKFGVSIDDFSVYESTPAEEAITKPVSHSLSSFMKKHWVLLRCLTHIHLHCVQNLVSRMVLLSLMKLIKPKMLEANAFTIYYQLV